MAKLRNRRGHRVGNSTPDGGSWSRVRRDGAIPLSLAQRLVVLVPRHVDRRAYDYDDTPRSKCQSRTRPLPDHEPGATYSG